MTEPATAGPTYDVFLSHNSADKPAVLELARRLQAADVSPFVDAWHLVPGEAWQEALEEAIEASRTCAVFVGPAGFGTWENEEMRAALSRRAHNNEFRVIPVILPGAVLPAKGRLPPFLSRLTWVDFRPGLDDQAAFDRLVKGIRGLAPDDPEASDREDVPIVCPFRGLEVFDEEHAPYFFGREALTQYLVEQLRTDRFLAVVGASGSGKSSVVRAGLVPHLRAGELPGSADWRVAIVKPGPHPLEALASRLAAVLMPGGDVLAARDSILAKLRENERGLHAVVQTTLGDAGVDARVLVVVDQFEEIFTLCHDEAERTAFVDGLLYASSLVGGQTVVVLTMRADFFGKAASLPVLAARLAEGDVLIPPMAEDELRRTMVEPAELAGLQFEKGLVDRILDDLGGEPGSLPLLQHTLLELFEGRRDRWLTIDHYHAIGGVRGAIAQRAEAVYTQLTPEQQSAARRILLRLTEPGEGTEDTRRRASVTELQPTGASPEVVEAVVNHLADARLLVTSENEAGGEVVDVAHEALIRGWPRLQAWINENPAALRVHRRLTETSTEWAAASRDPSYLFAGSRLDDARRWAADNDADLNDLEREFLTASEAARAKEVASRRRRVRLAIGGTAAAFVIVAITAVVAVFNWRQAGLSEQGSNARLSLALAEQLAVADPMQGLYGSFYALEIAQGTPVSPGYFVDVINRLLKTGRYARFGEGVEEIVASPDGKSFVVDVNGAAGMLVRAADGLPIAMLTGEVAATHFATDPGAGVFSVTYEGSGGIQGPRELRRTSDGAVIPLASDASMEIWFSTEPNARVFAVTYGEGAPGELRSVLDGNVIRELERPTVGARFHPGPDGPIISVIYASPDVSDVELMRATDGSSIGLLRAAQEIAVVEGPNDRILAEVADGCGIWDLNDFVRLSTEADCTRLLQSPDGSVIAFLTEAGGVVQRASDGKTIATLPSGTSHVIFSPDSGATRMVPSGPGVPGQLLRTDDGSVVRELGGTITPFSGDEGDPFLAFSADGSLLFAPTSATDAENSSTAALYQAATGAPVALEIPGGTEPESDQIRSVAFSPLPGGPALVAFKDGRRALFRLPEGDVAAVLPGIDQSTFWPGEGPIIANGDLAEVGPGTMAELRDAISGDLIGPLGGALVDGVRFDSSTDAKAAVVTFSTGFAPEHIALPEIIRSDGSHVPLSGPVENLSTLFGDSIVLFSEDASAVAIRYADGHTEVWDNRGSSPVMLIDLGLGISTRWIGPTGDRLATWDRNGAADLVDLELLRSVPADDVIATEAMVSDLYCGLVRRTGRDDMLPSWLAGQCP